MKAIVRDVYGRPEVLRIESLDKPEPKPNELRIRIRAVEVTKSDCELRSFRFPVKWFSFPLRLAMGIRKPRNRVLGCYFAGEVETLGSKVSRFEVGDRVFGSGKLRQRAYADFACYPDSYSIAKMPAAIGFEAAAASLLGGLNALHFLELGKLATGERILINGAGGSIGLFAIQMAKAKGAEVIAVDKREKEALIRSAGADRFIDYQAENVLEGADRYDVIFNMVPGMPFKRMMDQLLENGRYLLGNPTFSDLMRSLIAKPSDGKLASSAFAGESQAELEALSRMLGEGSVRTLVDSVLPPEEAALAHRLVETEQRLGSIVLAF